MREYYKGYKMTKEEAEEDARHLKMRMEANGVSWDEEVEKPVIEDKFVDKIILPMLLEAAEKGDLRCPAQPFSILRNSKRQRRNELRSRAFAKAKLVDNVDRDNDAETIRVATPESTTSNNEAVTVSPIVEEEKKPQKKKRMDLNAPGDIDDPETLTRIEKMKEQIQALFPENKTVHPKHKMCPVCRKLFYSRTGLLSHMQNKWSCRRLLPKQFAELLNIE